MNMAAPDFDVIISGGHINQEVWKIGRQLVFSDRSRHFAKGNEFRS